MERCQRCEERCIQVQNCRPRVLKNFPSFTCQNSLQQIRDWCPQITRWASSLMTAGRRTIVVTVRTLPFPCDPPISDWHGVIVWSNFEIGDLDFWRGEAYTKFVEFLDEKGGFYYEVRRQDRVFFGEPKMTFLLIALGRRARAQYWSRTVRAERSNPLLQRDWIPPQSVYGALISPPYVSVGA